MPAYNKWAEIGQDKDTEIQTFGDGSINIESIDANGNAIEIDLTLEQLHKLVKLAEAHKELFK